MPMMTSTTTAAISNQSITILFIIIFMTFPYYNTSGEYSKPHTFATAS